MTERNWILKEPGHLVLDGTVFAVRYGPAHSKSYAATKDNTVIARRDSLGDAKAVCTLAQADLEEIGIA